MSAPAQAFIPDRQTEAMFKSIAAVTKQSVPELLEDVMRLWVKDLVKQTYPKKRTQTANRIKSETYRLFVPISAMDSESIKASFKRGNEFDLAGGSLQVRPGTTTDEMDATRDRLRNPRTGHLPRNPGAVRKVVKNAPLKRHISTRQKRIGRLKGGWRRAATWAGAKMPSWVPTGAEQGTFADKLDRQTLYGRLEATNDVPYADTKLGGQFMNFILAKRFHDLTSGKYAMRWKKKMEAAKL